ncbi:LamG domain-containing protein [Deltaproteobacteria bacterium TL4]
MIEIIVFKTRTLMIPDNNLWTFNSDFSINVWINLHSTGSSSIGSPDSIFIGHDEGGGLKKKWIFSLGNNLLYFLIGDSTGGDFLSQTSFSPNLGEWYNISVTRSGNTFTTYVNGVKRNSETNTRLIPNVNAPLTIGQAEGFYTDGLIDEILIYNRALSESEIQVLYNEGQ